MSIAEALASGMALQWGQVRGRRPGTELRSGRDALAFVAGNVVEIDDAGYRLESLPGGRSVLVQTRSGNRVATVRDLSSGPAAINVGAGRYRLTRQGVLPFLWEVTEGLGGPQVLEILKLGSRIRVRGGDAFDRVPEAEVGVLAVLAGARLLGLLAPVQEHVAA